MRVLAFAALLVATPAMAEPPRIAASIPPVHSLVAMVTGDLTEPALLIPGGASPHDHALRPSEARALNEADIVVWIGPALETPLIRPVDALSADATVLTLIEMPGQELLPVPGGDDHDDGQDHDHDHDHDHGEVDPHVWLDPLAALLWLAPIAEALAVHDPENASIYLENSAQAAKTLSTLTDRLEQRLEPVGSRDYVVLHDAYGYFERRFGLRRAASFAPTDAAWPGARGYAAALEALRSLDSPCVFSEPQFSPDLARQIAEETGARLGSLDPMGQDLAPGPALYPALIEQMAEDFLTCLHE